MMAILGATCVIYSGILVASLTILTPFQWFRTRLVEISMAVAAFCVLIFFVTVCAPKPDLSSSLTYGSASALGAFWFAWLATRVYRHTGNVEPPKE